MSVATATAAPTKTPSADRLADYIKRCGGKDVLQFDTVDEARQAAQALRDRAGPAVKVDAQYTRVTLTIATST